MHTSSVQGSTLVGRLYTESLTPCLVFEAARDPEGNLLTFHCVAWNAAAEARARLEEPDGGLSQWVEALEGLLGMADCARVVNTGEPFTAELHLRTHEREVWWQATAVRQGDGFALWLRDVTSTRGEECQAREALERARAREERMEEEAEFRERFIGMLAHDLRNPLNAITLSAQTLSRYGPLTAMQRGLGQRIETSAERMRRMIVDLLDLTRVRRSGGIPLSPSRTSLSAVCHQVVEELKTAYPNRILVHEEEGYTDGVWDAERLAQVVDNLVSNALEHGGAEAPVFLRSQSRGELRILEVHNPGPPIPAHRLATLFEPFQGASSPRGPRRRNGLGLGLYIVREIVHAHGGRVTVRSVEGEGTTFTVMLPRDAHPTGAGPSGPEAPRPPEP
ncbi:MAG: HAMP domain-containing histidine kinase [Myxococcaceae bacterium]|nr:HAMP domain-containing histidine kinase [Myxococcaceae bacterium]